MFLFAKTYKNSIQFDFGKKVNLLQFHELNSKKSDNLNLSFSNSRFKKQQKMKLKNLFALEVLSLKKTTFKFILNKGKRKQIYLPLEASAFLTKNNLNYFCFHFSKQVSGFIKNLPGFYKKTGLKKMDIEAATSFHFFIRNLRYFYDIKDISLEKKNESFLKVRQINLLQKLSLYKLVL
jgi:hypothetical protein